MPGLLWHRAPSGGHRHRRRGRRLLHCQRWEPLRQAEAQGPPETPEPECAFQQDPRGPRGPLEWELLRVGATGCTSGVPRQGRERALPGGRGRRAPWGQSMDVPQKVAGCHVETAGKKARWSEPQSTYRRRETL